ncbi:TPA: hypothetical protein DF272_02195 [Candidatus Falkowbacteria bacterium]|nr:hypothetical protein [Candidatus Falkowbacteria bacterium]
MAGQIQVLSLEPYRNTVLVYLLESDYHGNPNSEKVKIKIFDGTGSIFSEFMVILTNYSRDELQTMIRDAVNEYAGKIAPNGLPLPDGHVGNFSRFWDGVTRNVRRVVRELYHQTNGNVSMYSPK